MDNRTQSEATTSNSGTLTLQGFTPYAQVPRWVLRSGKALSNGSVRLYGVIMTYAGNETMSAFPTRERLADDLGCGLRSISTWMKELEEFGALIVERRRNKRTGNFYANHYTLVFAEPKSPGAAECTPSGATECTRTRPTTSTTPTDSSLRSHHPSGDDEKTSSLRSPQPTVEADAATGKRNRARHDRALRDALMAFYVSNDSSDLEDAVEAYAATWNNSGDDMLSNHWAEDRTWDEINTRVVNARRSGKREPVSYAVGQLISEINNMVA